MLSSKEMGFLNPNSPLFGESGGGFYIGAVLVTLRPQLNSTPTLTKEGGIWI